MEPHLVTPVEPQETWSWYARDKAAFQRLDQIIYSARREVARLRSSIALLETGFARLNELDAHRAKPPYEPLSIELATERDVVWHWPAIAAHAAIDSLYQFAELLKQLAEWREGPGADEARDLTCIRSVTDKFNEYFPKWEQTRHATAHSAEIQGNIEKNAHTGRMSKTLVHKPKGTKLMMTDSFNGRTFTTIRKGEYLEFDVTWDNYLRLVEIMDTLTAGLEPKILQLRRDQMPRQP
jgi:hypothetical protein